MQRDAFYRDLVTKGIGTSNELSTSYPAVTPEVQRLYRKFSKMPKVCAVPKAFRLVNRFKTGADPEFVMCTSTPQRMRDEFGTPVSGPERDTLVPADGLGLKTGRAFGADMNGRLVEIRPHPSRNQLEVLASTLLTLRWMALTSPKTMSYSWRAGAFQFRDSLGGHVHFGRKRPTRTEEVAALDKICTILVQMGVYPKAEVDLRLRGDARGQMYGQFGDFRLQNHGYEYRTYPSWLDSPLIAYITLVLSKLAVHDPELVASWGTVTGANLNTNRNRLLNLLTYYKGRDDDARLLLFALKMRGFPRHVGGDFRPRWGLEYTGASRQSIGHVKVIPMSIPSNPETIQELYEHMAFGAAIKSGMIPSATWEPVAPPKGYEMMLDHLNTTGAKGTGELLWNLCMASSYPLEFVSERDRGAAIRVGGGLAADMDSGWRKRVQAVHSKVSIAVNSMAHDRSIVVPLAWREGERAQITKKVLLSGAFPIWDVRKVTAESFKCWQDSQHKSGADVSELRGKVLYEEAV